MGTKYKAGDRVWVPSSKLGGDFPYALTSRDVLGQTDRSVLVTAADGSEIAVSSRLVHPDNLGFLILTVGDFATESTLLDPLSKSILQFLRILVPDDVLHTIKIRSTHELTTYMTLHGGGISHIILVGHGTSDALILPQSERIGAHDFIAATNTYTTERVLLSAACKTGRQGFAGVISAAEGWRDCVAPHQEVNGAGASLFIQYLLHAHLLHGHEFKASARRADKATEGIRFRHWRNGKLPRTETTQS